MAKFGFLRRRAKIDPQTGKYMLDPRVRYESIVGKRILVMTPKRKRRLEIAGRLGIYPEVNGENMQEYVKIVEDAENLRKKHLKLAEKTGVKIKRWEDFSWAMMDPVQYKDYVKDKIEKINKRRGRCFR